MGSPNTGPDPCSPSSPASELGLRRTLGVGTGGVGSDAFFPTPASAESELGLRRTLGVGTGGVGSDALFPAPASASELGLRRTLPESGLGGLLGGAARGEAGRERGSKVAVAACSLLWCLI